MQYDVTKPSEYLAALEDDWRKLILEEIRSLVLAHGNSLEEGIQYKMLSYSDDKGAIFHLNAQKSYVSLYVGDTKKVDPEGSLLTGLNLGKGCIRFKKSNLPKETGIEEFIVRTLALRAEGEDISC